MRVIYNDVDEHFLGGITVIDVPEKKKAYAEVLSCSRVIKFNISIVGHRFGIIQPQCEKEHRWSYVSGINIMSSPDLAGSFLVTGLDEDGRLTGLDDGEIQFLTTEAFTKAEDQDGRVRYVLHGIE